MIKKFIASSVDKAQAKARRSLGKSAVILNIRDLPSGDVEVTAGDEVSARAYYEKRPGRAEPPLSRHIPEDEPDQVAGYEADAHEPIIEERRSIQRLGGIPFLNRRKDDKKPLHSTTDRSQPMVDDNSPSYDDVSAEPLFTSNDESAYRERPEYRDDHSHSYYGKAASGGDEPPYKSRLDVNRPIHVEAKSHSPITPRQSGGGSGSRLHLPLEQKFSENALTQLRERLTGQRDPGDAYNDDPTTATIAQMLKPHGISDRLMTMIRNGARKVQVDDDLYRLGMGLAESFNFSPLRSTAAVPLMLVGPTGAGKTSCAAKLAALALAEGEPAMMITTDVGRAGALEQFATYSEKLNIECYAAETPDDIVTIMHETQPRGAVILDTPGISPYDAGDLAALKSFQTAIGAEPVLVLPASGDVGEYTDWAHAFRAFGVRSCIITKFDATRRVGAGLSAAFEGNMTLTYFSETPFISEGLLPASPEFLAYRLTASYPGRIVQA